MEFYTSDIKVMVTIIDDLGYQSTCAMEFRTLKKGIFKDTLARMIMNDLNKNPFKTKTIIKVYIH